mmetsp:Transcript_27799/g.55658  ORF Transcript_27799/g.55658 Transcript_27799/m.55658 type:complete len:350 (-) Transcript_27799:887-1936(-)
MIRRECKRRKSRIFQILLLSCIILPGPVHGKVTAIKDNKIFWIDVPVRPLLRGFARLVQLWLKERPAVEGGDSIYGRRVPPAVRKSFVQNIRPKLHVVLRFLFPVHHFPLDVRVSVQPEHQRGMRERGVALQVRHERIKDGNGREAVRVPVERRQHVREAVAVLGLHCQDVPLGHGDRNIGWEGVLHALRNFAVGAFGKRGFFEEQHRVLVADGVDLGGGDHVVRVPEAFHGVVNEGRGHLLQGYHIRIDVGLLEDGEGVLDFLLVEGRDDFHFELLPVLGLRHAVHHMDHDGIEDSLTDQLEGQRDGLLLFCHRGILGSFDGLQQLIPFPLHHLPPVHDGQRRVEEKG